jgi:hypothetical protein
MASLDQEWMADARVRFGWENIDGIMSFRQRGVRQKVRQMNKYLPVFHQAMSAGLGC